MFMADLGHDTSLAPIKVLLIDDHQFMCTVVGRLLATEGDIEFHTCMDADAVLARAIEVQPTVIFQDLVMPGADGLTLVRQLRQHPATCKTPIIVLSANDDPESRRRAADAGASDYVLKLPSKRDLLACIRTHAAASSSEGHSGAAHQ
jgi:two-component system, chemotaxis family, response regulator WspR